MCKICLITDKVRKEHHAVETFDHVNLAVNTSLCYQKTFRSAFHYHQINMIQN